MHLVKIFASSFSSKVVDHNYSHDSWDLISNKEMSKPLWDLNVLVYTLINDSGAEAAPGQ